MKLYTLIVFFLATCWQGCLASPVKVISRGDDNAAYAIQMIKLGLQKFGWSDELDIADGAFSPVKLREDLIEGSIDVIWTATSNDMEKNALPVRIPLFKGLLGHRILIIHKDNEHLFDHVQTFEDAKKFKYGQGKGWTDTTILMHNGLEVVQALKYEGLFYMADGQRFHAYPRGVHEPWSEVKRYSDLELTVDKNVMFVYQMPYYLFVTPHKPELAEALHQGLLMAIDDGSFDDIFFNNAMVKMVMEKASLATRKIFRLDNPDLPPNTPFDNPDLWVDLEQF